MATQYTTPRRAAPDARRLGTSAVVYHHRRAGGGAAAEREDDPMTTSDTTPERTLTSREATRNGDPITVTARMEYGSGAIRITIGGSTYRLSGEVSPMPPHLASAAPAWATHMVRTTGGAILALDAPAAAAIAAAQADIDATPERRLEAAVAERDVLSAALGGLLDTHAGQRRRAIERASADGIYREPRDLSAEIAAAREALAAYDREHPEALAEIERAEEERIAAHMWD